MRGPQPGTGLPHVVSCDIRLSGTLAQGTAVPFIVLPMESLPHAGMGCADGQGHRDADPATALPADWRALPGRPQPKTLPLLPAPRWYMVTVS